MEKAYEPEKFENKIYSMWDKSGVFIPKINKNKKPFTIILPLPNANDPMHMGHALFTVQDIMIRYHRMQGDPSLWLPGGDHAGIETQFVFEKYLAKNGKSRLDYDRETLYKMIWKFANKNKNINKNQMKLLGFSLDWSRYHYSLEPKIVTRVLQTFNKLHEDGLIYRGERIVNYCTHCGTAFSELEVNYKNRQDFLYYVNYGPITVATTRPETIFADVAVAVNPKDKRHKALIGEDAVIPLLNIKIPIITDTNIDIDFGTGALKVTPAHAQLDYEIGTKNNLEVISVIDNSGKMRAIKRVPKIIWGLYVNQARKKTLEILEKHHYLIKKKAIIHSVGTCYKCGNVIEPLIFPQWFLKTKPLAKLAIDAVTKGETKIFPKKRFEKLYFNWMENIRDWNISRQIIWGPRIPIWYCLKCNPDIQINFIDKKGRKINNAFKNLSKKYTFKEISDGLQSISAPKDSVYQNKGEKCLRCKSFEILQESDTFDTWFLSGQWPLTTLGFNIKEPENSSPDFKYFYPTSVLDTLWDILFFWVGRMMMFGLYLTGKTPFRIIHLHSRVVDKFGKKMSKSRGNTIDPVVMVNKYGADALRMALIMGVAPASDISISEEKILGMRNFANKIWNISRFINIKLDEREVDNFDPLLLTPDKIKKLLPEDQNIISSLNKIIIKTTKDIEDYKFGIASEELFSFIWHDFADKYIESVKDRLKNGDEISLGVLRYVLINILKLIHPFMPFVTETVWQEIKKKIKNSEGYSDLLMDSAWPKVIKL